MGIVPLFATTCAAVYGRLTLANRALLNHSSTAATSAWKAARSLLDMAEGEQGGTKKQSLR